MVEIIVTDVFEDWFDKLSEKDSDAVTKSVDRLEDFGVSLGFPYSSDIKGSRFDLRELRIQSGGRAIRVFYAFDALRQAVLLTGGHKGGDKRFYTTKIRESETLWIAHL